MQPQVILHVRKGSLKQERYLFDERNTVIIGRSPESGRSREHGIEVPGDQTWVSRMHCLLDINPPDISVRDMGSLNGTFINGALIGKREQNETAEVGRQRVFSDFPLGSGDVLQIAAKDGGHVLELVVERIAPPICADCGDEIPDAQRACCEVAAGRYRCLACLRKAIARPKDAPGSDAEDAVQEIIELLRQNPDEPNLGVLKSYEILSEIGKGGAGKVYRAMDRRTGTIVALKVMKPESVATRRGRLRFERECKNMTALDHPNIVRIRSAACVNGIYIFDMELCNAGTIADRIKECNGVLPLDEALGYTRQLLAGLHYAHNAPIPSVRCEDGEYRAGVGLVHRDIKPGNLMLHREGGELRLKIGDFGLAKAFDFAGMSGLTRIGEKAGTPGFMCRQQSENLRDAKQEVDVWAAAACLYAMLTGCVPKPFQDGDDPFVVVEGKQAVPIAERRRERGLEGLPPALAAVIDQALNDLGDLPYRSASALQQALDRAGRA